MARPLRIEFPGAVCHVTSRGNARKAIFIENHYHLLIETPGGNLSRGMGKLNKVYIQGFNQIYRRVGNLLKGDIGRFLWRRAIPCGYTMKEIADHLGFHYATISRAIKWVEEGEVKCMIARLYSINFFKVSDRNSFWFVPYCHRLFHYSTIISIFFN